MVRPRILLLLVFLTALPSYLSAQSSTVWQDPSPHKVQFVTVDKDVKLEVLDWGGTGRPLVLLAGLGTISRRSCRRSSMSSASRDAGSEPPVTRPPVIPQIGWATTYSRRWMR